MSASAGFVDAGCYQRLHRTYTSHITGATASAVSNTVHGTLPLYLAASAVNFETSETDVFSIVMSKP